MSDSNIADQTVKAYAQKNNIDLDSAQQKLEDNYKKEVESVDAKDLSLKSIKAIREIGPKVHGLELREQDLILKMRAIQSKLQTLQDLEEKVSDLQSRLDIQQDVVKKTLQAVINEVNSIERPQPDLLEVIKWTLVRFKNYLMKSLRL